MTLMHLAVVADRAEPGVLCWVPGALQQTTRFFKDGICTCTLLVTYPEGSLEYQRARVVAALDGMPSHVAEAVPS